MKFFFLLFISFGCFSLISQEVSKEFTKIALNEQFDNTTNWNTTFNIDNLFLGQNGFYELNRLSKKSGYYIISEYKEEYSSFQLEMGFSFTKNKNSKQSFGVVLMANQENSNGILIEFNQKKAYRIVRVFKDKQIPINGLPSNWNKVANTLTKEQNTITIKTHNKVYDLYINKTYVTTFTDIELNKGKIGLYIGQDSKAKVDYLTVLTENKTELIDNENKTEKEDNLAFTQIIIKLKDQILRKDKEIDELKTKIKLNQNTSNIKTNDTAVLNERNRLRFKVGNLEDEMDELNFKVTKLEEDNNKLKEFKQSVQKNQEDGDIVINLSNMVSKQKKSIETLETQNKVLNNENNSLFIELKDQTKVLDKTTNRLTLAEQKNKVSESKLDSLTKVISNLQDSIKVKKAIIENKGGEIKEAPPKKPLTEEELLQQMIEKEREERRRKLEELNK